MTSLLQYVTWTGIMGSCEINTDTCRLLTEVFDGLMKKGHNFNKTFSILDRL